MLYRMLAACLCAGFLAGLATAALQEFTTTPLIIKAEAYEKPGGGHDHGGHDHAAHVHDRNGSVANPGGSESSPIEASENEGWAPEDGLERTFYSSVATIATGFGFALMLVSAMVLSGTPITPLSGLAWGAAAFVATGLAPALGLSPELPGAAAADLAHRQMWWIGTAIATAAGLFLALRTATPIAILAGLALICVPHLIGAPRPDEYTSEVPSELSAHFVSSSLVVHAVLWAIIGTVAGFVWQQGEQVSVTR